MIGTDPLARLIEASVLLKGERNLRPVAAGGQQHKSEALVVAQNQITPKATPEVLRNFIDQSAWIEGAASPLDAALSDEAAGAMQGSRSATRVYFNNQLDADVVPRNDPAAPQAGPTPPSQNVRADIAQLLGAAGAILPLPAKWKDIPFTRKSISEGSVIPRTATHKSEQPQRSRKSLLALAFVLAVLIFSKLF